MVESFSVKAILSAKDSGFSSTMKEALSATESLGQKIKSGFAFGVLTGAGQQAFSMLTNGAKELVGEINSSSKAWKTFEGNMEILGKGEDEIKAVKKTLKSYAETTIYSSSDMASSYAQLAAVGIKSADELVKGFGGLAGAAEDPAQAMKTLSQQGVQMAAKPTVAWQDFKLMLEQTPAGMAAVAKEMGMTTSQLVTAIQDGKVKTNKFFDAVKKVGNSEGFTKLATEYKSVDQAMDGLKETLANKLMPTFNLVSKKGINVISSLIDTIGKLKAKEIKDWVKSGIGTVEKYWEALSSSFSGVWTELKEAFNAVKSGIQSVADTIGGSSDPLETFKTVVTSVANGIKTVANFIEKHGEKIGKALPYVVALVGAYKGFKIVSTVVPGITAFTKGILGLAGKGIGGLAAKLFGISKAEKDVGNASMSSGVQMLNAAKSYALMGVAVLLIAASFALLVQSAIALSNAGGLAIGVMAGLVVGVVGLGIGMAALLKNLAPMSAQLMPVATAFLAMGAAVILISIGFAILAATSIALANAGGAAIGVMVGMVAAVALLAVGAAALGTALAAGAPGFIAFGVGLALVGVAAVLAATSLAIISAVLPTIAEYGLQGASAIAALGGSMIVFAVGAALAGAAAIVLGAGLIVAAVGIAAGGLSLSVAIMLISTAVMALSVATLIASASIVALSYALPMLAAVSEQGAEALITVGTALIAFGTGAIVAGVGALVLAAGVTAAAVSVTLLAVSIAALAIGVALAAVSMALAAAGLALLNLALPATIANSAAASAAMLELSVGLLALGGGALTASAGLLAFSGSAVAATVSVIAFGASMLAGAAGVLVMAAALTAVDSSMKSIAFNAKKTGRALHSMKDSVSVVESGLDALGDKAKSAMKGLTSAFDDTANKAESAGQKTGTGFANGLDSGLMKATLNTQTASKMIIAAMLLTASQAAKSGQLVGISFATGIQGGMVLAVAAAASGVALVGIQLRSGYSSAYSAGAYISLGFAAGMRSQLGAIESAAAQMAAAADKAVRAKAKIHSPSKVADKLGAFWGKGYVGGLDSMISKAWKKAEELVSVPQVATPALVGAYGGEMSAEYDYYRNYEYTIEVPVIIDGRETAKVIAPYTQSEIEKKQTRENRKYGKVK